MKTKKTKIILKCSNKGCSRKRYCKGFCKPCYEYRQYLKHKVKILQRVKRYQREKRAHVLKVKKRYRTKNQSRISKYSKKYWKENKIRLLKANKKYVAENKEKINERRRINRHNKSREKRRREYVQLKYHLSPSQHDALLKKQRYTCPISGRPVDIFSSIDHDHLCCPKKGSCGKCVRGILYQPVNSALSGFSDPSQLLKAYKYLMRTQ